MRKPVLILLTFAIGCQASLKPGTAIVQCPHDASSLPEMKSVPFEGRYELRRRGGTASEVPVATVEMEGQGEIGFARCPDQRIVAKAGAAEVELPPGTYYWTLAKESEMTGPRLRWYLAKRAGKTVLIGGAVVVVTGLAVLGGLLVFILAGRHYPSDR